MTEFSTPLMRQYSSIKDRHPDALLLFRLGDFYELFFEDAVVASKELQITLTSRNKEKGAAIPMCGVPYHAAEGYIAKLIRRGYRVAVAANGAEGIGLYRTEFPFIVRDAFPTLGEQIKIYRNAYDLFPGGPICFRILDLGGDKFVTGSSIAMARSAFHGYRSMRVLFDHPDVLRDQVQALALAAADRPLSGRAHRCGHFG